MKYLTILFALAIGAGALWVSQKWVRIYLMLGNWKRVDARVLSKEIIFNEKSNSPRNPYTIQVKYTYIYNNHEYEGNKVDLVELMGGFSSYRKEDAENRIAEILERVTIYVNPNDATQSVMNRKGIVLYVFVFFMGIVSILIGISKFF